MPCDYKCIFGISIFKSFKPSSTQSSFRKGFSYLVITGPSNRVYWFLFVNLGKTHYGPEIPRFSKKQEEELAKSHWDDKVSEEATFGDLYAARVSSVLTALPEYVFEKWHFRRVMTIGDAAHKVIPTTHFPLRVLTNSRSLSPSAAREATVPLKQQRSWSTT